MDALILGYFMLDSYLFYVETYLFFGCVVLSRGLFLGLCDASRFLVFSFLLDLWGMVLGAEMQSGPSENEGRKNCLE
jgi:hypothetical protein